ncbi:MAG: sulfite exporter TauE/SafE family protein [Pseudomonadota bacterium]
MEFGTLIPDGLSPLAAAGLVAVSALTSMMTAVLGIGGGVTLLAVMASLMPPAALIPVHGVVQAGSNAGRAVLMLREAALPVILPFALGGAVGALAGGALSVELPAAVLQLVIGGFILAMLYVRAPRAAERVPRAGLMPLAGAATSLLTMFVGATGPFVAALLRRLELPKQRFVATLAVLMTLQHALKIAVFGLFGFAFAAWLPLIAAMIATGFAGTVAGRAILVRMDEALFRRALDMVLTLLALRLCWVGVADLAA